MAITLPEPICLPDLDPLRAIKHLDGPLRPYGPAAAHCVEVRAHRDQAVAVPV